MTRTEALAECNETYPAWTVKPVRYIIRPCTFDPQLESEICADKRELSDAIDRWLENEVYQAGIDGDELELRVKVVWPYWAAVSDDGRESVKLGDIEEGEADE